MAMDALQVRDLSPGFGAEIVGLDLGGELDQDTCRDLRALFDDRGLLALRGAAITAEEQRYLAGILVGDEPPTDRAAAIAGTREYPAPVSNKEPEGNAPYGRLLFHSDMMWAESPMELLSLYGVDVEQPSVPTIFASAALAWETLPDDLRARVDGLEAVTATGQRQRGEYTEELLQPVREREQSTTKPIGYAHPRSGRMLLYVCQMMTSHVAGLAADESEELLEALFAHLYDPAHLYEHDWQQYDLVLWDNLALQHARPQVTLEGPARTLRKVVSLVPESVAAIAETPRFSRAM
jgi:alpha-ketoglutarate-dependent taurine dioxygenase